MADCIAVSDLDEVVIVRKQYSYPLVLACFRKLHQTSKRVFKEDLITAQAARDKINLEFRKHMDITDVAKIEELLKVGFEAEQALRETIIQAKLTDHGSYGNEINPAV